MSAIKIALPLLIVAAGTYGYTAGLRTSNDTPNSSSEEADIVDFSAVMGKGRQNFERICTAASGVLKYGEEGIIWCDAPQSGLSPDQWNPTIVSAQFKGNTTVGWMAIWPGTSFAAELIGMYDEKFSEGIPSYDNENQCALKRWAPGNSIWWYEVGTCPNDNMTTLNVVPRPL